MGIFTPRRTERLNQDTSVLARSHDTCAECGSRIPAGDVLCRDCE